MTPWLRDAWDGSPRWSRAVFIAGPLFCVVLAIAGVISWNFSLGDGVRERL